MGADALTGWDDYFIKMAHVVETKSRDLSQVGAVITRDNVLISTGFNGFARYVEDVDEVYKNKDEKLLWMVHAEENAIFNAARNGVPTSGCWIYVTKFPCFGCLMAIVQSGVVGICTDASGFWSRDPLDQSGEKKLYLIERARIEVKAPNFDQFKARSFPAGPSVAKTSATTSRRPSSAPPSAPSNSSAGSEQAS